MKKKKWKTLHPFLATTTMSHALPWFHHCLSKQTPVDALQSCPISDLTNLGIAPASACAAKIQTTIKLCSEAGCLVKHSLPCLLTIGQFYHARRKITGRHFTIHLDECTLYSSPGTCTHRVHGVLEHFLLIWCCVCVLSLKPLHSGSALSLREGERETMPILPSIHPHLSHTSTSTALIHPFFYFFHLSH